LRDVGRWEEAVDAAEEAVAIFRRLSDTQPDAYLPNLAGTLNNLGIRMWTAGRLQEAVEVVEESVKLWRQLTEVEPEAHRPGLAMALVSRGNTAREAGDHLAAGLADVSEAIELYQSLATETPAAYEKQLRAARTCHSDLLGLLSTPATPLEAEIRD
jgi:tetratricopeptide (TPR) repeat protein